MKIYNKQEKTFVIISNEEDLVHEEKLKEMLTAILQFFNVKANCRVEWNPMVKEYEITIIQEIFDKVK